MVARSKTHEADFTFNIFLDPQPVDLLSFGQVIRLKDMSSLAGTPLDGDDYRSYGSVEAVQSDVDAGFLPASAVSDAKVYFAQPNAPNTITFTTASPDLSTALSNARSAGADFYGVTTDSRTDADTSTLSGTVESSDDPMLLGIQSSESALTSSPSDPLLDGTDLSSVPGRERTIVHYHDKPSQPVPLGHLANRLAADPDDYSAPWHCHIREVERLADPLPAAAYGLEGHIRGNNANVVSRWGSASTYVKPGWTAAGRQAAAILTVDWFRNRLRADVTQAVQGASDRYEKIPVGFEGQVQSPGQIQMWKLARSRLQQGAEAGHFIDGQWAPEYPRISEEDINLGRIPLIVHATLESTGQAFSFGLEFTREPVNEG